MSAATWMFAQDALRLVGEGYGPTEATNMILQTARIDGRPLTDAERDQITEHVDDRCDRLREAA